MVQGIQSNPEAAPQAHGRIKRPWPVTFLALTVLILAVMFLISAWDALSLWRSPLHALLRVTPAYLGVRGVLWGVAALIAFIGLWRGLAWAPRLVCWGTAAFVLFYWLERFLLVQAEAWGVNGWFSAGMSILVIFLAWWIVSLKPSRAFFGAKLE